MVIGAGEESRCDTMGGSQLTFDAG